MNQLDSKQVAKTVSYAEHCKDFYVADVVTNKGVVVPMYIPKSICKNMRGPNVFPKPTDEELQSLHLRTRPEERTTSAVVHDIKVMFLYNNQYCVGGLQELHFVNAWMHMNPDREPAGYVRGLVHHQDECFDEMQKAHMVAEDAELAVKIAQRREEFAVYETVPELAHLLQNYNLTQDDFK